MPYIAPKNRVKLDNEIAALAEKINAMKAEPGNNTEGNMNYAISWLIELVYGSNYRYRDVNDVVGMLECAKMEFYRKVAAPYEDIKEQENGKVY